MGAWPRLEVPPGIAPLMGLQTVTDHGWPMRDVVRKCIFAWAPDSVAHRHRRSASRIGGSAEKSRWNGPTKARGAITP